MSKISQWSCDPHGTEIVLSDQDGAEQARIALSTDRLSREEMDQILRLIAAAPELRDLMRESLPVLLEAIGLPRPSGAENGDKFGAESWEKAYFGAGGVHSGIFGGGAQAVPVLTDEIKTLLGRINAVLDEVEGKEFRGSQARRRVLDEFFSEYACDQCEASVRDEDKFCWNCGANLNE